MHTGTPLSFTPSLSTGDLTMSLLFTAFPQVSLTLKHSAASAERVQADAGSPAAGAAFAAFSTLSTLCGNAISAIGGASFGPFSNSGSCTYDCGFREQTWSWSVDFTAWVQQNLVPVVQGMDVSGAFAGAFAPTQRWVTSTLPGCSTRIISQINAINGIDDVIKRTGITTPVQQRALAQAFEGALSDVKNSLDAANGALQVLSSFLTSVTGRSMSAQPYQTAIGTALTNQMNDLIGRISCGAGDVRNQFGAAQAVVNNSFASLQVPFNAVNTQYNTATDAGDVVAGVFLDIQSDSQSVTDFLNKAQGVLPTSPLRRGYLDIASNDWASLVAYAQVQLTH
jgi:hypothetical protein